MAFYAFLVDVAHMKIVLWDHVDLLVSTKVSYDTSLTFYGRKTSFSSILSKPSSDKAPMGVEISMVLMDLLTPKQPKRAENCPGTSDKHSWDAPDTPLSSAL